MSKLLNAVRMSHNLNQFVLGSFSLALFLLFLAASNADAVIFESGDEVAIESSSELADDLIATGKIVTIDGAIHGEALTFSNRLRMRGTVHGAMISAAASLNIDGTIEGSLVGGGRNIYIEGNVEGSSYLLAQAIEISPSAILLRDLHGCAGEVLLEGRIVGDLVGYFGGAIIDGTVDGDLDISCDQLEIRESAEILGNLTYTSSSEAIIEDGAVISGSIKRIEPDELISDSDFSGLVWVARLYSFIAILIVGLIALFVMGDLFRTTTNSIRENGARAAGFGIIFYAAGVVAVFFLFITGVGLPASILISLIMGIVFFVAKIFVASALGSVIFRKGETAGNGILAVQLALGLAILGILFAVPVVGWFFYLITAIVGSGGLTLSCFKRN